MTPLRRLIRVSRRFAGRGILGLMMLILLMFGLASLLFGPVDWVSGLRSPHVAVDVEVAYAPDGHAPARLQDPRLQVETLGEKVGVLLQDPAPATLTVENPGLAAKLLRSSGEAAWQVAFGLAALTLIGVLSDLSDGVPFSRRNARRLGLIALLIGIGGVGSQVLAHAATTAAIADAGLTADSLLQAPEVNWFLPVLAALAVLGLAEAFRVGARLSQEVEGLV